MKNDCHDCEGTGEIVCDRAFDPYDGFEYGYWITCPTCGGKEEETDDTEDEA